MIYPLKVRNFREITGINLPGHPQQILVFFVKGKVNGYQLLFAMRKHIILSASYLMLLLFVSCGNDKPGQNRPQNQFVLPYPVIDVPVKTVTAYTTYPASIEGIVNSEVRAKIPGYITEVLVDEGEKVRRGQTLFKLETRSMDQDAAAAKANILAAQVEVDKLRPLVEKEIISSVLMETAKANLEQAKSRYNSIIANIDYATIKSPVNGYVGEIRLRKGALVSPNNQTPLTTVSDISAVYAYFSMNEKEYLDFLQNAKGDTRRDKIKNLPPVTLILANGMEYPKKGKIETINSQINSNSGTVSFRAEFDNSAELLTNGSSGIIKVPSVYENVLVVPQESTFEQQEKTFVYKVSKDTTAVPQAITVKAAAGNLYIVSSGLTEGERIVAKGVGKLQKNMPIKPQQAIFDSIVQPIKTEFR